KVLVSRVGLLTVVRLKPETLKPASAKNAADGIVAFSAVCTHYGCPVTTLHPSQSQIVCNCHGSVFDAADRGAVTQGPATRRLAMLPLAIRDGALVVAAKFDGPLGPPT
ncbi:MAG TPA: Rieske (2Fe-2S) protein, partial [Tahibacter sp.]|nr:Rieske (2Fe-2S) protein [Tahibacter sp.]